MTEKKDLCIIVPIYKDKIEQNEKFSLDTLKHLAADEDIFFIMPKNLNLDAYGEYPWQKICFADKYFKNVDGYTKLLLNPEFYNKFIAYKFMLIYQTDALLLKPIKEIYEFIKMPYDYYGAPWFTGRKVYSYSFKGLSFVKKLFREKICYVGNGGFSLRHISHTIDLLEEKKKYTKIWNMGEDVFFAYHGMNNQCGFSITPVEIAQKFALEEGMKERIEGGHIPLGIHAWEKYFPAILNLDYNKMMPELKGKVKSN